MTSELRVDNLKGSTTGGSISVLGEGTSATTNLQQGLAKCWCFFNGTGTIAISDSFNVASLTDDGTGDYDTNLTNAMGNLTYAIDALSASFHTVDGSHEGATTFNVETYNSAHSAGDSARTNTFTFGDLA